MLSFIKTPITLTAWFLVSLFFTLMCIPLTFLPNRHTNRLYFFLTTVWCKLLMFFSFIHVTVRGEEHLPDTPAIIVINHTSCLDIFFIEQLIGSYPHIWLSKMEYAAIPLFSTLLNRMHVPVTREDPEAAAQAIFKVYKRAKHLTTHILMFPEGKRYDDGVTHEFHPGFALLAKKLNRPVIPIHITGFHKIFSKQQRFIQYHAAKPTATIGKPMYIQNDETIKDFSRRVHAWFT